MSGVLYTVRASFTDPQVADEFVAWLVGGHAAAVVAGGATSARVVRLDTDAAGLGVAAGNRVVEVHYEFPSRRAYEAYAAGPARALREEGRRLFGAERGVVMERRLGEIQSPRPV